MSGRPSARGSRAGRAGWLLRRVRDVVGAGQERGSAVVEFVVLGTLLLVPVVYLVLCVSRLQAASFAVEGAAREAARVVAGPGGAAASAADADAVVSLALADQGFDREAARLQVRCEATPCASPDALVEATVTLDVVLPGVPALVAGVVPASVEVRASGSASGDRFAVSG
ncbi:pilus assembly protein [Pseudokineococcus basanitobsidens]|uniref:Pilus assembly protein n=1 Tax=Pseudokineococcus basanitobsidens TaxID=1926649 RepID=A0ABU8RM67_9ACTN